MYNTINYTYEAHGYILLIINCAGNQMCNTRRTRHTGIYYQLCQKIYTINGHRQEKQQMYNIIHFESYEQLVLR